MTTHNPLLLESQLCFALYSTSLAMTQLYKELLTPLGLTYPQYTIMLILWQQDGLTLKAIADRLGQKSGSLTPVIKRMEVDGLIKRVRGKADDRALSIELTETGAALKSKAQHIYQCAGRASGMTESQIVALKDSLVTLRDHLSKKSIAQK